MKTIRQLIGLFEPGERKQIFFILGLIVLMAVVETLSIISILPFIALLSNPAAIEHSRFLSQAYDYIGRPNMRHFMIFIGMGVLAVLVLSNAINAYTYRAITYFTYIKSDTIARRLLINYMAQPYTFFLNQNTSHLTNIMLNEVAMVVKNVLIPVMNNVARIVATVFILALLLFINPGLTLIVLSVLGGSYFAIYMLIQRKLAATGARRVYMSLSIFKTLSETLNAAKEIKILGQERNFIKRFSKPSLEKARCFALHETLGTLPRYFLETVAFGGILVIILYMMIVMNDVQDALPVIALYAFAGQRLMPSMQNIFSNMAKIQSSKASLDLIAGELGSAPLSLPPPAIGHLPLRSAITLKNLTYRYEASDRDVLNNVSLTIDAGSTVAFVGGTGAGKTTLVDLLLGVLTPDKGVINIDDTFLHEGNMREWQASLGYVPQKIVLFDDSVTRNIACGLPDHEIDMVAVKEAAEIANIDKFILTELPGGYDTMIGENGIRLSGGQRQRLGIARALYRDPDVLVLDEATSALDNLTEEAVIEAVSRLAKRKTIIMIAHRLSTVQGCDVIHMMEHGRIIGSGSYEELLRTCAPFRRMAEGGREQNYMAQA